MFSFSGRIAEGASDALDKVLERRMREQLREQQEQQHQDQIKQAQDQLAEQKQRDTDLEKDRAFQRTVQQRTIDLADLQHRDRQTALATEKAGRSDMANVMQMPGLSKEQQQRELAGSSMRTGVEVPRTIIDLMQIDPKKRNVTVPGPGGRPINKMVGENDEVEEWVAPRNPPPRVEPSFVQMPDGSYFDTNRVAPPGATPALSGAQAAAQGDKKAKDARAVTEMKRYGDDMLATIDEMLDDKGQLRPHVGAVVGGMQGLVPELVTPTLQYGKDAAGNPLTTQGAHASLNRLQGMLDVGVINDMKNQSRTGATGFGALSAPELAIIESAASKLRNRRVSDSEYATELNRLRRMLAARNAAAGGGGDDAAAAAAKALIEKALNAKKATGG